MTSKLDFGKIVVKNRKRYCDQTLVLYSNSFSSCGWRFNCHLQKA